MSTFCFERYALRGTQPAHVIFINVYLKVALYIVYISIYIVYIYYIIYIYIYSHNINFNGYTVIVFISGNSVLSPFKFVLFRREIRYASKA